MKLHLNLSLRRALMAAMAAVCTLSSTAYSGVVDGRYDLQYYLDFCRNKGMFATGATNIEVFFKDGTSVTNNTIPLMPNMDSYGETAASVYGDKLLSSNGGTNLISSQFVYGAKHVHAKVGNTPVAFLSEGGSAACTYTSANLDNFGTDSAIQRLTKLVTAVAYTPMADDDFMRSLSLNTSWIYRLGSGGTWSDGKYISIEGNALGGVVNLSVKWQDTNTGEWYLEGWARKHDQPGDTLTPLEIGTYFGDSGSPIFAWDDANNRFLFVGAQWAGGCQRPFPNWYLLRYNYQQGTAVMDKYTVAASFSGTDTILWSASDATSGKGTLTQGAETIVDYTGKGTGNSLGDSLGLTFSTDDTASTRELQLQGNVNMGAGALTFESGKWRITETEGSNFSLSSAGLDISEGAEVTWELTGVSGQEIRKVGEGILTVAGSGDNAASLVVGGGTTVYNVVRDENGNITGCTLGNAGETRLNRTNGYAASSVRLEGGVAILVLMADNQFKTNSVAGDTFSFGNDGGLLNLNGHDLSWGVINQNGSGTGARIGNFTPLGEDTPDLATFTYTGTGTFAGSFMDEGSGEGKAQLAVVYNNTDAGTWKLTGQSTNAGGYTVQAGTMVLEGSLTPHVRATDRSDWTFATMQTSEVAVKSGATFQLSHHALMKGDVTVESGGSFILNQTVNAASESVSGSLRKDMASLGITSLVGNVTLNGEASMTVNTDSPVTTTMKGNIDVVDNGANFSSAPITTFVKNGSGVFVVDGKMGNLSGTVNAGGLVIKDASNLVGGYRPHWTIGAEGFMAAYQLDAQKLVDYLTSGSSGVLALTSNQETSLSLDYVPNLYIGAYAMTDEEGNPIAVTYGSANLELAANSGKQWLLGGGGGTLNVAFKLTGGNDLIIGNEYSSGTVHLTNTANDFTGDIYIKGSGNMLTYEDGALGSARVALSYGNTLALNDVKQLSILKEGAAGVLALSQSQDIDLSGKKVALAANGALTYTGALTVDDVYRFGGKGDLTLDTDLSSADKMELDGQGNSGSSVTFARKDAYSGEIVAGGGLYLDSANSAGDITIRVGHAEALASVKSIAMKKGAVLDTEGLQTMAIHNLSAESGTAIRNSGSTSTLLQLDITENLSIADGVLSDDENTAGLALVKTGIGTLTVGANTSWSGGLTIMEGTVKGSLAVDSSDANYGSSGGIGKAGSLIYVDDAGTLSITGVKKTANTLAGTQIVQTVLGTGTLEFSTGGSAFLSTQTSSFEGTVKLTGNTRVYLGADLDYNGSGASKKNTLNFVKKATMEVTDGSQARITSGLFNQYATRNSVYTDFIISGSGYRGEYGWTTKVDSLTSGALAIDFDSTVYGNVTLATDATISSNSNVLGSNGNKTTSYYGIKGYLGGTIRGQILGRTETDGTASDLTIAGNESMTFTADSANTFGDLFISNGNGNNDDKFALRLNGGAARSQVSTALGTGDVSLNAGLILRFGGTGIANNTDVVYTYENDISAGAGASLQSYNITNKLTGTVSMGGDTLNLKTANGGVLELAGGINGSGTLNVGADSKVILGSAATTMALTRSASPQFSGTVAAEAGADITLASPSAVATDTVFTGTDSLTLRFGGTDDYTLGGITMSASDGSTSVLTLNFDFSGIPSANDAATWTMLTASSVTSDKVQVGLDLNMFNDIARGEYTLVSGTLAATEYAMVDNLNGRLSLRHDATSGNLVLVVGGDNRLYWRTDGASQEWNTADANWYLEGVTEKTTYTAGKDVVFDAEGVADGNSAASRETVSLAADPSVGVLAVKDACYEISGEAALTGKKLAVGEQGDLKLSTTSASFANGVQVDNAKLQVSGTALTADVSATNGGSFAMSDRAALTGNIEVDGGTVAITDASVSGNISLGNTSADASIANASVTGKIATQGSGSATLDTLTLTGEITSEDGGRIITASAYDGSSATYAAATLSGSLNWGGESGHRLSLTSGSLYLDGKVKVAELAVGDGLTATVWNNTAAARADKILDAVSLGNNAIIQTNDRDKVSAATHIGNLSLAGASATLRDQYHSGYYAIDSLSLGEDITSATLNIVKKAASSLAMVVNLGSEEATAGNFKGTISLKSDVADADRSLFLVLGSERTAAGAVVNMNSSVSSTAVLGLGVNTDNAVIAGLSSASGLDNRAKVFSGSVGTEVQWGSASSVPSTVGDALRTLTIDTAAGDPHNYYGEIMSNLNLVKTGAGTQKLLGTSTNFNGSLSIEGGTLVLGSSSAVGTLAGLSVSDGATLDLSAVAIDTSFAGLSLAAGATGSFGSGAKLALGALEAETTYHIFDLSSGATLNGWDSLGAANFSLGGTSMLDMGRVNLALSAEDGTFTYYVNSYDLVWNGGESGTWNRSESNTPWLQSIGGATSETSTYFANNDNVTFNSDASVNVEEAVSVGTLMLTDKASVTLKGSAVSADKVVIESGSKLNAAYASVLVPTKAFDIAEGAELEVNVPDTLTYTAEVSGKGTVTMTGGGTLTWNPTDGTLDFGTLNITGGGTFKTASALTVETMNLETGKTATLRYQSAGAGKDKLITNLNMANGAVLQTYDESVPSAATRIGTLTLQGSTATLKDMYNSGYTRVDTLKLDKGVSSSTLVLNKNADSANMSIFELGSASAAAGNFAGTIELKETRGGQGDRSAAVILSGAEIARQAVISISSAASGNTGSTLALGINADKSTIAGLSSASGLGSRVKLFSGTLAANEAWGVNKIDNAAPRTLTINTAAGKTHEFYGEVLGNLNLVISGSGTQKFLGTAGSFDGSLTVKGGTLGLNSTASAMLGSASAVSLTGGVLDLSAVSFSAEGGIALGGAMTVTNGSINLGTNLAAGTTYHIFDLSAEGASLANWTKLQNNVIVNGFAVSRYSGATLAVTDGSIATLKLAALDATNYTDMVWNGGSTGTWDYSSANWDRTPGVEGDNIVFADGDGVSFASAASVSVVQAVTAAAVSVTDGATVTLKADAPLRVAGSINMEQGTVLNLQGGTHSLGGDIGSVSASGTVNFSASGLDLGTAVHSIYGDFKVQGDATITSNRNDNVNDSYNKTGVLNLNGKLSVGSDSTLTLDGNGRVVLAAGAELALADGATMKRTANGAYWLRGQLSVAEDAAASFITTDDIHLSYDNGSNKGTISLGRGSSLEMAVSGKLNFYAGAGVSLAQGAELKLTNSKVHISNKGATAATMSASDVADTAAQAYSMGNDKFELTNAHVKSVAEDAAATLSNKLTNSSVENAGSGHLTVSNSGNSITDVYATGGDLTVKQLQAETALELGELVVSETQTVSLYTGDSTTEANVIVSKLAKFEQGATLNANLTLKTKSTLSLAEGSLAMGSTLTLQSGITLDDATLARIHANESTTLFTGVDGLTLDGETVTTELTAENRVLASTCFANLNSDAYVFTYTATTDGNTLSIMAIPEPTTTTLSLLALVALASRRRRK